MITYTEGIPILMGLVINFPQVNTSVVVMYPINDKKEIRVSA